ncbi:hypothetical protein [Streptomyces sp. NPDC049915]|uniref:hypothetical protein n=1 Tax=Streptomyces sp. NPDC049915 TaxID=3155510 RepID=UPI00341CD0B6
MSAMACVMIVRFLVPSAFALPVGADAGVARRTGAPNQLCQDELMDGWLTWFGLLNLIG